MALLAYTFWSTQQWLWLGSEVNRLQSEIAFRDIDHRMHLQKYLSSANGQPEGVVPPPSPPPSHESCSAPSLGQKKPKSSEAPEVHHSDLASRIARAAAGFLCVFIVLFVPLLSQYMDYFSDLLIKWGLWREERHFNTKYIAYRLDVWYSTKRYSKPVTLLGLTLLLVVLGTLSLFSVSSSDFYSSAWEAVAGVGLDWTFVSNANEHSVGGVSTQVRLVATATAVGGMLVTALMLGLVSEAIGEKMDDLKKGTSAVLETNHSLILGWSDKLLPIVKQLSLANESEGGGKVVILSERSKEEMERDIELQFSDDSLLGSEIICRSGSPLLLHDLHKVSASRARSIIVLAVGDSEESADARALRVLLSLAGLRDADGLLGHIVVELSNIDSYHLANLVGGDRVVETVVSHDIIGRLMLQCAMQPGLAAVWESILGFEGNEFYFKEWPELVGCSFKEAMTRFPDAVPLGIRTAADGKVHLNPPGDMEIGEGDELFVLAEDDDTYDLAPYDPRRLIVPTGPQTMINRCRHQVLFCGWRRDMESLVRLLDDIAREGSELFMLNQLTVEERERRLLDKGLDARPGKDLQNIRLRHVVGDIVNRKHLEQLPLESFDSIMILAGEGGIVDIDSRSLATLLLIRDIQQQRMKATQLIENLDTSEDPMAQEWMAGMKSASAHSAVISEILDTRTRHLIADTHISDYVLSNELVAMTLAMVSENQAVNALLGELFSSDGNEIYLRQSTYLIWPGEAISFAQVMSRGLMKSELVIGYRKAGDVVPTLNPTNKDEVIQWEEDDIFVVIAEDENGN